MAGQFLPTRNCAAKGLWKLVSGRPRRRLCSWAEQADLWLSQTSMCPARAREASGIVTVVVPHVRRWHLAVQKESLCAERMGTACHLNGFVTTRMTVVTAQMRRVSVTRVWQLQRQITESTDAAASAARWHLKSLLPPPGAMTWVMSGR